MTPSPDDINGAAHDLAALLAAHEAETDPAWRAALDAQIRDATAWLAEMIETTHRPAPTRRDWRIGL
jgi:hypothetical protein